MSRNLQILDWQGYHASRPTVDFWLLAGADGSHDATPYRLMQRLREQGIGDAQGNSPNSLSYSSTGAIYRTAMNHLQRWGFIEEPWANGRRLADPLLITADGAAYLATLPNLAQQESLA